MSQRIIVYCEQTPEDRKWARQFAGYDSDIVGQFPNNDFGFRDVASVPAHPSWDQLVAGIEKGAGMAGNGGLVCLLGGHGGSGCVQHDQIDPRCTATEYATAYLDPSKKLVISRDIVFYDRALPYALGGSQKDQDEAEIQKNPNSAKALAAKARQRVRGFYDRIGAALRKAGTYRFVFLSCYLGASPDFLNKIHTDWGAQIASFKYLTTVIPDDPGQKARFVLARDRGAFGQGTNVNEARCFTPSLADTSIAYIAQ